jgi:hypothetical protein
MMTRAWGIVGLLVLASQAQAATLAEVTSALRDVELQLLILDVQAVGARARLSDQQFQLDRQIMLIQATGTFEQQIAAIQSVVKILVKHQDITALLDQANDYRANVSCYYESAKASRDDADYDRAIEWLTGARRSASAASGLYTEANRVLAITDIMISELRARVAAW